MKISLLDALLDFFHDYMMFNVDKTLKDFSLLKDLLDEATLAMDEYSDDGMEAISTDAIRVYSPQESNILGVDCRNLLLFLEHHDMIDSAQREMIIEELMEHAVPISLMQFKQFLILTLDMNFQNELCWLYELYDQVYSKQQQTLTMV